jgi:hypothetical protein
VTIKKNNMAAAGSGVGVVVSFVLDVVVLVVAVLAVAVLAVANSTIYCII